MKKLVQLRHRKECFFLNFLIRLLRRTQTLDKTIGLCYHGPISPALGAVLSCWGPISTKPSRRQAR